MNDPIAALLYLLGRHVATALRVRREDEEIVLSRRQAPPLRELHDALERGEQISIDPWVDLEDGARGLVCLWARTPCPEVTVDDLPAALRPQAWVQQGGSALTVWSLAKPDGHPGGIDPARAMREVAGALGITPCDPRDYIPVPRDPQDLVIIEPGRDTDAVQLVQWAHGVLAEQRARDQQRREREETAKRTVLGIRLVTVLAAVAEKYRKRDEVAARAAMATTEDGDAHEEDLRHSDAGELEERAITRQAVPGSQPAVQEEADPWAISSQADDITAREGHRTPLAPEPEPADQADAARAHVLRAHIVRPEDAYRTDDQSHDAQSRLAAAIADARTADGDEERLQAILVEAMAELGTRDVWAALGVAMTRTRDGALEGLRGGRWLSLREVAAAFPPPDADLSRRPAWDRTFSGPGDLSDHTE